MPQRKNKYQRAFDEALHKPSAVNIEKLKDLLEAKFKKMSEVRQATTLVYSVIAQIYDGKQPLVFTRKTTLNDLNIDMQEFADALDENELGVRDLDGEISANHSLIHMKNKISTVGDIINWLSQELEQYR
jgi:hypothetical protein